MGGTERVVPEGLRAGAPGANKPRTEGRGRVDGSASGAGDVAAIVVTFESAAVLPNCLDGLRRNGVPALVVDNASRDDTVAVAERLGADVLRNLLNEGYGRANNLGARALGSTYILVVNPDVVLEDGAVAELRRAADRHPEAGMLAPRIVEPDGRLFFQARSLLAPYLRNPSGQPVVPEGECCAPFLSGACFMMKRELFLSLGGFDRSLFLFYEDDDLCRRLADRGLALVHVHGAVARHVRGGSSAPEPGRVFNVRWHLAWSRAFVAQRYGLPSHAVRVLLLNGLKTALACLTFRRSLMERYAGSAAGTWAFLRGRSALDRQGLGEQP
ncbi:MAG: glycosyltransferase family 2 protein [Enterovirga sp.]|nr:glycosyltransferase family 2 protein [Enterovirga sp.]